MTTYFGTFGAQNLASWQDFEHIEGLFTLCQSSQEVIVQTPLERKERISPLKYIMSVVLLVFEYFIEKKFGLSTRVWIFILEVPKFLPKGQILGAKSAKKCYHVGILEAFHL